MTRAKFVERVAWRVGSTVDEADRVMEAMLEELGAVLAEGGAIELGVLGRFDAHDQDELRDVHYMPGPVVAMSPAGPTADPAGPRRMAAFVKAASVRRALLGWAAPTGLVGAAPLDLRRRPAGRAGGSSCPRRSLTRAARRPAGPHEPSATRRRAP